jgi:hypothetical protein
MQFLINRERDFTRSSAVERVSKKLAVLVVAVVVLLVFVPGGYISYFASWSKEPPFPTAWSYTVPQWDGSNVWGPTYLVGDNSTFALELSPPSSSDNYKCLFTIQSIDVTSGQVKWTVGPKAFGTQDCALAGLSFYNGTLYLVDESVYPSLELHIEGIDASSAKTVSLSNVTMTGMEWTPNEPVITTANGTVYVVDEVGVAEVSVFAASLVHPAQGAWERNVTFQGYPDFTTQGPVLHADAEGISILPVSQSRLYMARLSAAGSQEFIGTLPENFSTSSFFESQAVASGVFYYLGGSDTDQKVVGVRLTDCKVLTDFSIAHDAKVYGSAQEVNALQGRLIITYEKEVVAYSTSGENVWSFGSGLYPTPSPRGYLFLQAFFNNPQQWNSSAPGGLLHDATYALLNATSGHVLWRSEYYVMIGIPPWTPSALDDRPLPTYGVIGYSGLYMILLGMTHANSEKYETLLAVDAWLLPFDGVV